MFIREDCAKLQITSLVREGDCAHCYENMQWRVCLLDENGKTLETIYLCGYHLNGLLEDWSSDYVA